MARHLSSPAIRTAIAADVANLARVQLTSALAGFAHIFPESVPKPTQQTLEAEWSEALADETQTTLVAELEGVVVGLVGFGTLGFPRAGTDCTLRKLYVTPDQAGLGIGSALHDEAIERLRASGLTNAHLWVLERNIAARRMYVSRGWRLQPWTRSEWPGSGILELCYTLALAPRL